MERQNGMSEIGDNWSWEEDFQKDLDEGAAEVDERAEVELSIDDYCNADDVLCLSLIHI